MAAYTCDATGLITYFNSHAEALWGRRPLLNDPIDRFCGSFRLYSAAGAPIEHRSCWMALALEREQAYNGEEILVARPDGSRATVLAHANPIRDESGRVTGAVNLLVDISERPDAERAMHEFLAVLAHELRNPLAPIRNSARLLHLLPAHSADAIKVLEVIDRQVAHMSHLIDDLLDVSRITRGKFELRRADIALTDVIRAATETSEVWIAEQEQELLVELPAEPVTLHADLTRLAQVVANLLHNASKFSPPGRRIWLSAARDGEFVAISVRDEGAGIGDEGLTRIFDSFGPGGAAPGAVAGGLGIGLTLVRRLTEMHGGEVCASSEGLDRGSTFTVRLPVATAPRPAERGTSIEPGARPGAGRRVLVVDDNRDAADSQAMLLRLLGHDVRVAYDGRAALAVAGEFVPDAVLLDIGLPAMSGYDVARELRAQPHGAAALLIATTGWSQSSDREKSRDAGFDHHLVKPVDAGVLLRLLEAGVAAT